VSDRLVLLLTVPALISTAFMTVLFLLNPYVVRVFVEPIVSTLRFRIAACMLTRYFRRNMREGIKKIFLQKSFDKEPAERFLWDHIHLAPYLVARAPKRSAGDVLESCLFEIRQAIDDRVQSNNPTFDSLWPILECYEEVAEKACGTSQLDDLFMEHYVKTCLSVDSSLVKAVMVWGTNELIERETSKEVGKKIAIQLFNKLTSQPGRKLKTILGLVSMWHNARIQEAEQIAENSRTEANKIAERLERNFPLARTPKDFAVLIEEGLSPFVDSFDNFSGADGILNMAKSKFVLRSALKHLRDKHPDPDRSKNTDDAMMWLVTSILNSVNKKPERSAFLAIEACEAIRDLFPRACAKAMAEYLRLADPRLAQGIAVCIAEGYEEEKDKTPTRRFRLDKSNGKWKPAGQEKVDLDEFFNTGHHGINERRLDHVAHWINQRLDLHPAAKLKGLARFF